MILTHGEYGVRILGLLVQLPLELLIGTNQAEAVSMDNASFENMMKITHSCWDRVYEYRGSLSFPEER